MSEEFQKLADQAQPQPVIPTGLSSGCQQGREGAISTAGGSYSSGHEMRGRRRNYSFYVQLQQPKKLHFKSIQFSIYTPHGILALIFIFVVSLVAIKVAKWPSWPPVTTLRPKHSLNQSRVSCARDWYPTWHTCIDFHFCGQFGGHKSGQMAIMATRDHFET